VLTKVDANFKIKRAEKDTDPYFEFSASAGTVPSKKSVELLVLKL
jgi:hypothetical protein